MGGCSYRDCICTEHGGEVPEPAGGSIRSSHEADRTQRLLLPFFLPEWIFCRVYSFYFVGDYLPACMYVYHLRDWCLRRSERGISSPGTVVGESPYRCWKSNLGSLQEQLLLTAV